MGFLFISIPWLVIKLRMLQEFRTHLLLRLKWSDHTLINHPPKKILHLHKNANLALCLRPPVKTGPLLGQQLVYWYKCPLWHHKEDVAITEHLTADFLQREKPQLWRMDFSHLCRKQTPRESCTIGELLNEPVGLFVSACASAHPRPSVLLTNEAPGHPAHTDISSAIRLVVIPDHFGWRRISLRSNFPCTAVSRGVYSLHNKHISRVEAQNERSLHASRSPASEVYG